MIRPGACQRVVTVKGIRNEYACYVPFAKATRPAAGIKVGTRYRSFHF